MSQGRQLNLFLGINKILLYCIERPTDVVSNSVDKLSQHKAYEWRESGVGLTLNTLWSSSLHLWQWQPWHMEQGSVSKP